jgi:[acyl-carrier-protein] S-malonyltransferase
MKKIALVFPGQGSQAVGMLHELAAVYPVVQETFAEATAALGYDLWALTQQGPEEQLNQTEYAQPALLTAGVAVWRVWQQVGGAIPAIFAGHSLGEYTALVCAEALKFIDGVRLVAARGRIMQEAVPAGKGAMAAIVGLEEEQVVALCQEAAQGAILQPANYNSIGQIVIAGEMAAVQRAIELAKAKKAKIAKLLAVSIPSHCALMQGAASLIEAQLAQIDFNAPKIPVVHNADAVPYNNVAQIKDALVRQLYSPVRWVEIIKMMQSNGVNAIFECGPGKVLCGLNKRIVDSSVVTDILGLPQNLEQAVRQ